MSGEQQQKGQDVVDVGTCPEKEAGDLRELHLSATFLTPYSVTPTEDNNVWLSNTQQAYVDHMKQGARKQYSYVFQLFIRTCLMYNAACKLAKLSFNHSHGRTHS